QLTEPTVMPALFIGHGSPMNAIEANEFSRAWLALGKTLPKPKAILCISAHWQTDGAQITAMPQPKTIHDFFGFPQALFDFRYPAPGDAVLAERIRAKTQTAAIELNYDWGLDHGGWSILCRLFPAADIPVLQLSLNRSQPPAWHYQLGKSLRWLRQEGVLIIGSGNIVHNLRELVWEDTAHDWAVEFAAACKRLIAERHHQAIIDYQKLGDSALLSVPTDEHFLPLLYILALQNEDDETEFFNDKTTFGAISMLSMQILKR
ncbi:MAG: 4,5-DOPA dioxygenase extradiol, partial [Methylomonas sp.]